MKLGHFNKRVTAAVGRLPFPGRHLLGPVALRAIRTPDVQEKRACCAKVVGLAAVNTLTAIGAAGVIAADCMQWLRGEQTALQTADIGLDGVMLTAHAASAYAQVNIVHRIKGSIAAIQNPATPFTVGIEDPMRGVLPVRLEQNKEGRDGILFIGATLLWLASLRV